LGIGSLINCAQEAGFLDFDQIFNKENRRPPIRNWNRTTKWTLTSLVNQVGLAPRPIDPSQQRGDSMGCLGTMFDHFKKTHPGVPRGTRPCSILVIGGTRFLIDFIEEWQEKTKRKIAETISKWQNHKSAIKPSQSS